MRRTYSVRPLLRLDSGREQPHAQLRVGRAARYDGSRPSAYDQRRAHVDRLSAGGQHRAIQHRISRPRTPRRSYPAGRLPSQGRRISRRAGRQGKGLHSGIPRHQLRLRHGARIPPRRRRGRRGGIPQPYFGRHILVDRRDETTHRRVPHTRSERRLLGRRRARRQRQVHCQRSQQPRYSSIGACASRPRRSDPRHLQRISGAGQVGTAAIRPSGLRNAAVADTFPQRHQPPHIADRLDARGHDGFAVARRSRWATYTRSPSATARASSWSAT